MKSLIVVISFVAMVMIAYTRQVKADIFLDSFDGPSVDYSKWFGPEQGVVAFHDGTITVDTSANEDLYHFYGTIDTLNFAESPDNWTASTRFKLNSLSWSEPRPNLVRNLILFSGSQDLAGDPINWGTQGFDIRISRLSDGTYRLGWNGWDNVGFAAGTSDNFGRVPIDLNQPITLGQWYDLVLHRKPDGNVDIFVDGHLISTQSLIGGLNPESFIWGNGTSDQASDFSIDYFRITPVYTKNGCICDGKPIPIAANLKDTFIIYRNQTHECHHRSWYGIRHSQRGRVEQGSVLRRCRKRLLRLPHRFGFPARRY